MRDATDYVALNRFSHSESYKTSSTNMITTKTSPARRLFRTPQVADAPELWRRSAPRNHEKPEGKRSTAFRSLFVLVSWWWMFYSCWDWFLLLGRRQKAGSWTRVSVRPPALSRLLRNRKAEGYGGVTRVHSCGKLTAEGWELRNVRRGGTGPQPACARSPGRRCAATA